MGKTLDLGRRVELVSMDPHFHGISIGLYRSDSPQGPALLVHSYSRREGARGRLEHVARAMAVLGGLQPLPGGTIPLLGFPCGAEHPLACRRVFLEACKLAPDQPLEPRALTILDKRSNLTISVESQGAGVYRLSADGDEPDKSSRIAAVANGLAKLAEMQPAGTAGDAVAFACGSAHDALVGLLLARALNVRAVLREDEMAATRGVLAAPSAQK